MTLYNVNMTRPVRGKNPYFKYANNIFTVSDEVRFIPGVTLEVDNVWEMVHLKVSLTTSAVVANRKILVRHYVGGGSIKSLQSVDVAASLTKKLLIAPTAESQATDVGLDSDFDLPMFTHEAFVVSGADDFVQVLLSNPQAGDAFTIWAMFKYMNYQLGIEDPYNGSPPGGGGSPPGIDPRFD